MIDNELSKGLKKALKNKQFVYLKLAKFQYRAFKNETEQAVTNNLVDFRGERNHYYRNDHLILWI